MALFSFGRPYYKKACHCGCGTCGDKLAAVSMGAAPLVGAPLPEDLDRVRRPSAGVALVIGAALAVGFTQVINRK